MFWLFIGLMTAVAVGVLVAPLLRSARGAGTEPAADRAAYDRAVYRDQLAELARDQERGIVTPEQAAAARTEIERRLLATADDHDPVAPGSGRVDPITTVMLAGAVTAGAIAVYLAIGSPHVPDQPLASRDRGAAAAVAAKGDAGGGGDAAQTAQDLAKSADSLQRKLKEKPDDAESWVLLARTQAILERWQDAAESYKRAIALTGGRPDIAAGYGEMLVFTADGIVTPAAREAFETAIKGEPDNLAARFYLAAADAQAGKPREAVDAWMKLAADSPADAPWVPNLKQRIAETAQAAGLPVPKDIPTAPPREVAEATPDSSAAPRGPTASDIEAAQKMSTEERQNMIRSMVDGLAARLEKNPDDPAGWARLANAYRVLGQQRKAAEAEQRGAEAQARVGNGGSATAAAAPSEAAQAPAARGPNAADIQAAQNMSAEDRQAMIRSMIEGLAARLEKNPDDPAGWARLANAYRVLGQADKAADAERRGAEAQARAPGGGKSGGAAPAAAAAAAPASSPPGPTGADMDAAAKMSPADRQVMIRSMVEGLAARLDKNPQDPQGWVRLANAYRVLGEPDKAAAALDKGAAANPENVDVLMEQARALLVESGHANGIGAPLSGKVVQLMRRVNELDPKQPEALWYVGLAEAQQRRPKEAAGYWRQLLTVLPPGSEDHRTVRAALDALKYEN